MGSDTISDASREPKKWNRDRIGLPETELSSSEDIVLEIGCKSTTLKQRKKKAFRNGCEHVTTSQGMHRIKHTSKWEGGNEDGMDRIGDDCRNSQRCTEECSLYRCATFGTPPLKHRLVLKVAGKRMQIDASSRWIESWKESRMCFRFLVALGA
ncbi:unnamed protein product [Albugo candida]|uniref:Uncharacterized protein n=1 Tax=Albugo candida TaxID=65357 RepID=A0A024GFE9_9STRA|nr:unnamed protein product [Albugo candida]|eukprot:CCI45067.1 unnamed protein product [Albugo candida]